MKLSGIQVGDSCKAIKIMGEGVMRRRLLEMGITKGVSIYLRKKAPLGDPIQISLRGYELTLRKDEADFIEVENV